MISIKHKGRLGALLFSAMLAFGTLTLAGCDNDSPPNENAQPEQEQPMGQGPMSNEDAGETPSDDV